MARLGKIWQGKIKQDLARILRLSYLEIRLQDLTYDISWQILEYYLVILSKIWQDMTRSDLQDLARYYKVIFGKICQIWQGKIKQDFAKYDEGKIKEDLARYDKVRLPRFGKICQILPNQDYLVISCQDLQIWQGHICKICQDMTR